MPDRKQISNYLAYRDGDAPQQVVVWDTVDICAGRLNTQDIVIRDSEVSRQHAIFRREGDRHVVEDLNTAIGTLVNGERITVHNLEPGDRIRVGSCEFVYGRTEQQIRPGEATRYASELKSNLAVRGAGGNGRTALGFDSEDPHASSAPTVPKSLREVARVVSADGVLEEVEGDDPLALSLDSAILGLGVNEVRDLDLELDGTAPAASPRLLTGPSSDPAPPRMTLVLEVEAATFEIAALVHSLYGRQIGHPLLRIRIKKPDEL